MMKGNNVSLTHTDVIQVMKQSTVAYLHGECIV